MYLEWREVRTARKKPKKGIARAVHRARSHQSGNPTTFGRRRLLRPLYALPLRWGPQHQESPRRRNHGETSSLSALPLDSSMNDVVSAAFDNREDISLVLSSQERRAPHCRYALFYLEGGEKLDRPYPLPRKANMAKRIWHLHQFLTSL